MRFFAVAAVAFATSAAAQSSNSSKVYSVEDLGPIFGTLSENDKRDLCRGQTNGCDLLCNRNFETNDCTPDTLKYECVCSDGSTPALQDYTNTLPTRICQRVYIQCIEDHPNDRDGQEECTKAMEASCDEKNLKDPADGVSSGGSGGSNTGTNTSSAAETTTTEASSNTASADGASATGNEAASTTDGGNFAAPTGAPVAGAAAVAVAMVAYLV